MLSFLRFAATYSLTLILLFLGILLFPERSYAQQEDTTSVEIEYDRDTQIDLDRQLDRPMSGGSMTEMGTYSIPSRTQYYKAPFTGQESLDKAVEAYRKEMEERWGDNWYWQFLKAVSPYVKLHLGVSEFNSLQIIDRDNPIFKSYKSDEKID